MASITSCFFSAALQMWTCYQNSPPPLTPIPLIGQQASPSYAPLVGQEHAPTSSFAPLQPYRPLQPLKPLGDMELP